MRIIFTPFAKDELTGPRGEGYRRMIALSPAGRGGTRDEVGGVGALLMWPDRTFITGSDFLMDGGVTTPYWSSNLNNITKDSVNVPATRTPPTKESTRKISSKPKAAKSSASKTDGESIGRLPTTLKELKESKGGLVATPFLSGRDRDGIAQELKAAFKMNEAQALKVTRRITGRVRLYQTGVRTGPGEKVGERAFHHRPSAKSEGLFRDQTGRLDRPRGGRKPVEKRLGVA